MKKLNILIGCEESQAVCIEMRKRGHNAFSCDIIECSGGHQEWHIQGNVLDYLGKNKYNDFQGWDMMVAFPDCTYFCRPGIQYLHTQPERKEKLNKSFEFLKKLWSANIDRICIENPIGWLNTNWRKPNQIIHPWYFGDNEMKETCLWLRGLPRLNGKIEVAMNRKQYHPKPEKSRIGSDGKMKNKYFMSKMTNAKDRSKTFRGIARAMAEQWTEDITKSI